MALKQTRRSISLNRRLYDEATRIAGLRGIPLSQITEDAILAVIASDIGSTDLIEIRSGLARGRERSKATIKGTKRRAA